MSDIHYRKWSGEVCHLDDGYPIVWEGHLCEGANLTAPVGREFCLWTRCGKHDVPANAAHRWQSGRDVTCPECRAIAEAEEPTEAQQGLIPIPEGYNEP